MSVMNCHEFVAYFLVTFALLFGSNVCNKIVFRDDDGDAAFVEHNILDPVKIPERLLIQMRDITNLTEFLTRFVGKDVNSYSTPTVEKLGKDHIEREHFEVNFLQLRRAGVKGGPDAIKGRARTPLAGVPTIAKAANCQPEQKVVELEKPGNGAIFLWPPCVRVRRCGGCCTSKMLTCSPVETSINNITVLQVKYNPQIPDSFESQGYRVFPLEEHDRCTCRCKQREDSCGPLQEFRKHECRCACVNQEEASECTSTNKVWDSSDCMCKCRRMLDCSTGRYFNPLKCSCEMARRSLGVNNLDRLNASLSELSILSTF